MKIDLHKIPIRKMIVGYKDSAEEGVVAFSGKLDIRPNINGNLFTRKSNAMP